MFSDAGKAFPCRRRDIHLPAFHISRSRVSAFSLAKLFYLFKPFRIFSSHVHLSISTSNKGGNRRPATPISHPLPASSSPIPSKEKLPNCRSRFSRIQEELTKLSWFPSCASTLASTPQLPPFCSPEMLEPPQNPSASQYGRRSQISQLPSLVKLGFHLVGLTIFGPLRCSKPTSKSCDPSHIQQILRSDLNSSLPKFSQSLCCFMNPIEQGHQLGHNAPSLLVGYKNFLRTLPLVTTRVMIHETNSLKEFGIMIPLLRSGDYRSFLNLLYTFLLNSEPKQVIPNYICDWWIFRAYKESFVILRMSLPLSCVGKFFTNLQTVSCLMKNGILTLSPRRSGYRIFYNPLSPPASSVEPFSKSSYALSARAVYDHTLVEDFAKPVFMVESAMVSTDFSKFANFLKVCIFLENSWNRYFYFLCDILVPVCMNFPPLRS